MKERKFLITINRHVSEVFEFTINPINTAKWIDGIEKEETNEWPVKVNSIYRNIGTSGKWNEYTLTRFEENKIFELTSKDGRYHVRYTYAPITDNISTLEYFEWVDEGELSDLFSQSVLEKLKVILESDNK